MAEEPKETIQKHLADAVEYNRRAIESLRELWNDLFKEKQEPICLSTPKLFPQPIRPQKK